jgi:hypothetical protein
MVQVVETLEELGVEPLMTQGTKAFFLRSSTLGLEKAFESKPEIFWEVPNYMERNM